MGERHALDKRGLLGALGQARTKVRAEIEGNRHGVAAESMFARGLANEGWAGGYLQALDDVEALLRHGYPADPRGYWRDRSDG